MVCSRDESGTQFGVVRELRENGLELLSAQGRWRFDRY
jgi:hypothetical protein